MKSKASKKVLSVFLTLLIICSVIPLSAIPASAATGLTLSDLQSKYPQGKYWNGGDANSYTSSPCNHHGSGCSYSGSCGCNTFKGHAIQCMGFAYQLAYIVYGGDPYVDRTANRNSSALSTLKAGDIVRYKNDGHSIFVTNVNGDIVTYADCNSDGHCIIRWNQTISKSTLKSTFTYVDPAPYEWKTEVIHTHSYSNLYFEAAHPHRTYGQCSCGATQYDGGTTAYASCSTCMATNNAYPKTPIKAYTIASGKTTVYTTVGMNGKAKSNRIYDTDECTIDKIYACGWCKVTFPLDSGGTDSGYVQTSVFFKSEPKITVKAAKQITTYSQSGLTTLIGYAGANDKIYISGHTSSAVQVIYPLSNNTYKVGWISKSDFTNTFTFNANGGTGTMPSVKASYQNAFTLPENTFTRLGYTFASWSMYRKSDSKWYTNNNGWETASSISANGYTKSTYKSGRTYTLDTSWVYDGTTSDIYVMYANWTPNTYIVKYNANGGTGTMANSSHTYDAAKALSANAFTRTGYTFLGWATSSTATTAKYTNKQSVNNLTSTNGGTVNLYAVWSKNAYTIKYNANGGIGTMSDSAYTYDAAKALAANTFTRNGYKFLGWSTNSAATTATYTDKQSVKNLTSANGGTVTLYAVWEKLPVTVTGISIQNMPTKTVYEQNETFSSAGLSIKINYSDGTSKTATSGFTVSKPDMATAGTKSVTVTYEGKTVSFNITVNENKVDSDAAQIVVENKNAVKGNTVEVSVKLENNPGIASMTLRVNYDTSAMKLLSVTDAGKLGTSVHSDNYTSPYTLCWANDTATENLTENGTVVTLKFEILDNTKSGNYPISVSYNYDNYDIYNTNVEKIKFETVNGGVTVADILIGDVNSDGVVNNLDRLVLTRYLANWVAYPESVINLAAADVNMDGTVNNLDRLILTRYLANWNGYGTLPYSS